MENNFDKILADKIRGLSENTEFPYNAAHWDQLLATKKKRKKRVFLYWRVAAILLVGLLAGGLGAYFYQKNNDGTQPLLIEDTINKKHRFDSIKNNKNIFITDSSLDSVSKITNSKVKKEQSIGTSKTKTNYYVLQKNKKTTDKILFNEMVVVAENTSNTINEDLASASTVVNKSNDTLNASTNKNAVKGINKAVDRSAFEELVAAENTDLENASKKNKSVKIGMDFAPAFSYNEINANAAIGFNGGIVVAIPLNSKFDVTTGVYYANQKINLADNQSTEYFFDAANTSSSIQEVSKEALISAIEIPINVKYNFKVNKKDFFIAAGVSSTSYIKESIEENYIQNSRVAIPNSAASGTLVQYDLVQTATKLETEGTSSGFNFANIINVSIGIELPLNDKKQSIIIAPYFKYGLKSVTTQNLNFSNAGIHMRYNLLLRKKE